MTNPTNTLPPIEGREMDIVSVDEIGGSASGATEDQHSAGVAERLAQRFHETYERLAPQFSYKTRKATAVPWAEVGSHNKGLMIAVAGEILAASAKAPIEAVARVVYEQWAAQDGYVPWVLGGNSLKQGDARRIARSALQMVEYFSPSAASAGNSGLDTK